ncbi:hypothetical protein ERO13_A05G055701v2 [Gossypium hirsutum]|nr:hypothetical protein ERO13_A05G055701v2 [Gossypium hirsutum]
MADESAGRRIPFAFLEDMHQRFVRTYGGAVLSALPYGMNDEFSRVLSQQMEYYSNDPNADRINRLKGEMSQGCAHNNPHNCCLYRDCVCLQGSHVTILCLKRGQQFEVRTRSVARCFFFPFVSVFVCLFLISAWGIYVGRFCFNFLCNESYLRLFIELEAGWYLYFDESGLMTVFIQEYKFSFG